MVIRKIDPLSLARNFAIVYTIVAAVLGVIRLFYDILNPMVDIKLGESGELFALLAHYSLRLLESLFMAVVLGFVGAYLFALIYNKISPVIGPISIEIGDKEHRTTHRPAPAMNGPHEPDES